MELWVSKVTMISLSYNCNNLIIIVWKSSWLDKCRKYSIAMWRDVWLNPVETNPHKQQWVHELARTPATLSQKEQTQDKTRQDSVLNCISLKTTVHSSAISASWQHFVINDASGNNNDLFKFYMLTQLNSLTYSLSTLY